MLRNVTRDVGLDNLRKLLMKAYEDNELILLLGM
jgi:hypothetical protein